MPRVLTFKDYAFDPAPEQIDAIYSSGFPGVLDDGGAGLRMLQSGVSAFYDEFPGARGAGEGKLSLPIRAMQALLGQDFCATREEAQRQGDCVGKMCRNSGMTDYCVDALFGETTFKGRFACENIYGMRGHGGEGASCAKLAHYVSQAGPGGFLVRDEYAEPNGRDRIDLSQYRPDLSGRWGRRGTPDWLNQIAAENPALRVYLCRSVEEARDALAMGFGLGRCGTDGYASTRNEDGVSRPRGRWNHAISVGAVDDTPWAHDQYDGPLWLHYHDWGKWNSGPKRHDQPEGSWWVEHQYLARWIEAGSCWAFASVRGYDRQLVYARAERMNHLETPSAA